MLAFISQLLSMVPLATEDWASALLGGWLSDEQVPFLCYIWQVLCYSCQSYL